MWVDDLIAKDACEEAVAWARGYPSLAQKGDKGDVESCLTCSAGSSGR